LAVCSGNQNRQSAMSTRRHNEDRPPLPGAGYVEDYTLPFLVAAGVLCFILLFAIWAAWGIVPVLAFSILAERLIPQS